MLGVDTVRGLSTADDTAGRGVCWHVHGDGFISRGRVERAENCLHDVSLNGSEIIKTRAVVVACPTLHDF